MLFPLNIGVSEVGFNETYTTRNNTNAKDKAFKNSNFRILNNTILYIRYAGNQIDLFNIYTGQKLNTISCD